MLSAGSSVETRFLLWHQPPRISPPAYYTVSSHGFGMALLLCEPVLGNDEIPGLCYILDGCEGQPGYNPIKIVPDVPGVHMLRKGNTRTRQAVVCQTGTEQRLRRLIHQGSIGDMLSSISSQQPAQK